MKNSDWVKQEMSQAWSQGIETEVEGVKCRKYTKHLNRVLKEDGTYMKEYVADQDGKIVRIAFRHIDLEE
ncbi:MAG: hypothetical protein PUB10_04750 [Clostridiales bacterium]|nr:hypothetical protein [Clostridiales bacterium]